MATWEELENTAKDYFGKDNPDGINYYETGELSPDWYEKEYVPSQKRNTDADAKNVARNNVTNEVRSNNAYAAQSVLGGGKQTSPVSVGNEWRKMSALGTATPKPTLVKNNDFDYDAIMEKRSARRREQNMPSPFGSAPSQKSVQPKQIPGVMNDPNNQKSAEISNTMNGYVKDELERRKRQKNLQNLSGFNAMSMAMQVLNDPEAKQEQVMHMRNGQEGSFKVVRGIVPKNALAHLNDDILANGGKYRIDELMVQRRLDAHDKPVKGSEDFYVKYVRDDGKVVYKNFRIQDAYDTSVKALMNDGHDEASANQLVANQFGDVRGYVSRASERAAAAEREASRKGLSFDQQMAKGEAEWKQRMAEDASKYNQRLYDDMQSDLLRMEYDGTYGADGKFIPTTRKKLNPDEEKELAKRKQFISGRRWSMAGYGQSPDNAPAPEPTPKDAASILRKGRSMKPGNSENPQAPATAQERAELSRNIRGAKNLGKQNEKQESNAKNDVKTIENVDTSDTQPSDDAEKKKEFDKWYAEKKKQHGMEDMSEKDAMEVFKKDWWHRFKKRVSKNLDDMDNYDNLHPKRK